jgi:hypothetical protein
MVAVGHLLILSLVLFGFWLSHRYISRRFIRSSIHCPTQLALKGQYEAPPRGWNVLYLIIQLIIPRLMFFTAITGLYLILIHDFALRSTLSTWFSKPDWEWKLPVALAIGVLINLIVTCRKALQPTTARGGLERSRTFSCDSDLDWRTSPAGFIATYFRFPGYSDARIPK